jgi:hypothetical protein
MKPGRFLRQRWPENFTHFEFRQIVFANATVMPRAIRIGVQVVANRIPLIDMVNVSRFGNPLAAFQLRFQPTRHATAFVHRGKSFFFRVSARFPQHRRSNQLLCQFCASYTLIPHGVLHHKSGDTVGTNAANFPCCSFPVCDPNALSSTRRLILSPDVVRNCLRDSQGMRVILHNDCVIVHESN